MNVNHGVREVAVGPVESIAGWVEDVSETLLHGQCEFLLGAFVQFLQLGHLIVGQVLELAGLPQRLQRDVAQHLGLHVGHPGRVCQQEDEIVPVVAPVASTPLVQKDFLDQVVDGDRVAEDLGGFVAEHHQVGASAAVVVGHVVRAGSEGDEIEVGTGEEIADEAVEAGARLVAVGVGFFAPDDLGEIGLGQKAQRRTRFVVEIRRVGREAFACVVNECDIRSRAQDGVAQFLGVESAQGLVERQGVHEGAAGDVRSILRKAPERPCVELLSQGRRGFDGGNLGLDGRHVDVLLEAGDEFEAYRLEPEVDVMRVNRVGVGGPCLPDACDRTREETQHAAYALEVAQGAGFLRQHIHEFWV